MPTSLASKVLPDLATGALISLGNFGMDKILGQGWYQNTSERGGFLFPRNRIDQLAAHKNFNADQKTERTDSCSSSKWWQACDKSHKAKWWFLVTLLVSILIPLLLNALTGKGIQNRSRPSRSVPRTSLS